MKGENRSEKINMKEKGIQGNRRVVEIRNGNERGGGEQSKSEERGRKTR